MDTKQPEALRLEAEKNKRMAAKFGAEGFHFHVEPDTVIDMLDRIAELEAQVKTVEAGYAAARLEIASLQAQLEAVGAGGVEPLRKRCLHQISEPASTEPRDVIRASGGIAHSDGSILFLNGEQFLAAARAAVAAQAQPVGAAPQWVRVDERLPDPGNAVLLDIGEETPLRAMWAAKHTVEAGDEEESGFCDYDEATDTHYCPEGWYEWNQQEETHWAVSETPVAWMNLPAPYSADAAPQPAAQAQPVGAECPSCGAASEIAGFVCVDCYYAEQKTGELSTDYVQGFAHGQATLAPPQPAAQALDAPTDTERLDFLAEKAALVKYDSGWKASLDVSVNAMAQHGYIKDLRAAIDAAIAAQQGSSNG